MIFSKIKIKVTPLPHFDPLLGFPRYETEGASGVDLRACFVRPKENKDNVEGRFLLKAKEKALIPTGLAIEVPKGFEAQIRPRSGTSLKTNLSIPNSPGTIDSDYRGEIFVLVENKGLEDYEILHGMRIAQLVILPVYHLEWEIVETLSQTNRQQGGFGHTGI